MAFKLPTAAKVILLLGIVGAGSTFLATKSVDSKPSITLKSSVVSPTPTDKPLKFKNHEGHEGNYEEPEPTTIPLVVPGGIAAGGEISLKGDQDPEGVTVGAREPQSGEELFSEEDLSYLEDRGAEVQVSKNAQEPQNTRGLYGGKRQGARQVSQRNPEPTPEPEEEEEPEEEPQVFYEGHTRGYVMLYLMQPEARPTVERQLQAMLESGVKSLYLSVLTDGTFGKNYTYLSSVVTRLNQEGRRLTLVLYLTNGPTMRQYDTTPITAGFNRIEPKEFRDLIRFSPSVRDKFRRMVKEVKPIFALNQRLNPQNINIVVPMLEDNLNVESYKAMRDLVHLDLGTIASIMRNPCFGCYEGNDQEPLGDLLEFNPGSFSGSVARAYGFTLDGEGYIFGSELNAQGLTLREVQQLQNSMASQGIKYFGLWREARQGIQGGELPHPSKRKYEVPTTEQLELEIELLRSGLRETTP